MQGKIAHPNKIRAIALALANGKNFSELEYMYGICRTVISRFKKSLDQASYSNVAAIKEASDEDLARAIYPNSTIVINELGDPTIVVNRTGDDEYLVIDDDYYVQKIFDEHITKEEAYRQYCDACNQQGLKEFSRTTFYKRIKDRSADYNRGLDAIMTLKYNYGEEIQLDFIGKTVPLTMADGTKQDMTVCVLVWPASYYTFAIFIPNQSTASTCYAVGEAYKFFGCLSQRIVPDNAKCMVTSHQRGREAILNASFENYMSMLGVEVLPTPVYMPTAKSSVEYENRLIKERVYPHIDKNTPKTLEQHNADLIKLVNKYVNQTELRKCGKTRTQLFELYEKPKAKPLNIAIPEYEEVIVGQRVPRNYHLTVHEHQYSVPYSCTGYLVNIHVSATTVKFYHHKALVSVFPRIDGEGVSTNEQHMPANHKAVLNPQYEFKNETDLLKFAKSTSETLYEICKLRLKRGDSQRFISCSTVIRHYCKSLDMAVFELALIEIMQHQSRYDNFSSTTVEQVCKKIEDGLIKVEDKPSLTVETDDDAFLNDSDLIDDSLPF